jgi:hypothetical protein
MLRYIVALFLILASIVFAFKAMGLTVSGGHLGTLLGNVCPATTLKYDGEAKLDEPEDCSRLVEKALSIRSQNSSLFPFLMVNSAIFFILGVVFLFQIIRQDKTKREDLSGVIGLVKKAYKE